MIYYKSRDIASKLGINLAKWKRWSRDFLPPDPLGGLQSGVARQFNFRDVFKIFMGGYLVGDLKFTIPEAVRILADLSTWLKRNEFYNLQPKPIGARKRDSERTLVYIYCCADLNFTYCIRTIAANTQTNMEPYHQETYRQTLVGTQTDPLISGQSLSATVIAITALYHDLLRRIA